MSLIKRKQKNKAPAHRPRCAAVVAAAGTGERMGGGGKMLIPIAGIPLIGHCLLALERADCIDEIVIAARPEDIVAIAELCRELETTKVNHIIKGGENRVSSVLLALSELSPDTALVAVHDGARPCLSPALCARVVQAAALSGAAIPCLPVTDTLKAVAENGIVSRTVDRAVFRSVQTPQCFAAELLKGALSEAQRLHLPITDDSSALERIGVPVTAVEGEQRNIKVTTPEDVFIAAALLACGDDT